MDAGRDEALGLDYDEDPRSVAPAKLCSQAGYSSPFCAGLGGPALASTVARHDAPRSGEHDAHVTFYRNPNIARFVPAPCVLAAFA
jgi:hypothetical protein